MLLVFLGLFSNLLFADSITKEQAKLVASNFYNSRVDIEQPDLQKGNFVFDDYLIQKENDKEVYYVFNVIDDKGFIIISADDDAFPILAYSFTGSFDIDHIAPATLAMLESYQKQIVEIQTKHLKADENIATQWQSLLSADYTEKGVTSVDPLLITTWRQGLYYNPDCPVDGDGPDGHALVGCVATAMAQIMKYHSYPAQGTGSHSYYHEDYGTLSADFGNSTYDWASMPNNASGYNTALAQIGSHCGISVDMNYGPDGSGASTSLVAIALVNYFDYKTSAQMKWKEDYSSAQWDNLLINEINNNRPMEYRGSGPDGGHAFVLDGYQGASNNHFHFNWGWGGSSDGYYYLSNLNPGGYTFNDYQGAIIGIEPNGATNYPPVVINPIDNVSLDEGFGTHTINLSNVFDDVDGDVLTFSVVSSNTSVVGASISGITLTITENTNGSSSITVTASDGNGGTIDDVFSVYVSAVSCDPPINLTAEDILQDGHTATLNWEMGSSLDEFRYDDGTALGQLGFETGTTNSVLGSVHPIGAELNEMSWYLTANGGPHTSVTLYVMGLDGSGVPDENNVLFTTNVSNTDEVWNTYAFTNAIIADDGFFLGVAYDGFVALGTDDGVDAPYEYVANTHYYSFDYPAGAWSAWESSGFEVNGMIRAMGVAGAVNSYDYSSLTTKENLDLVYIVMENPVNTEDIQTRGLSGHNVYRDGNKINTSLVSGTTYDDSNAAGYHCYEVTAVYDDCGESDFSNEACVDIAINNSAPIVINPISDVDLNEGFGTYNIDFSNVFEDADDDELTYSVSSSNTSVVGVSISGTNVVIIEAGVGTATITLTADDGNGGTVDDVFTVSVNAAANNPPVVINPIADIDLDEGFGTYNIDFSNVFEDADDDVLSYTVSSSNTSVVGAGISSNNVVITEAGVGSATVTLTADDGNGGTVADVFIVNVNAAANNPPVVINPIADVDLDEGFGTYNIDFSNVFDDVDGDVLSYSVSSSNTSVVGVSISGTNVVITEAGIGSATITLAAADGNGGSVDDAFIVNVNAAANNPPVVINPIADVDLDEGFGTYNIDFSNVFDDVDGDVLSYSISSSNTSVVSVGISGTNVVITEAGIGSATITLAADDGNGGSVDDVFIVNVNAAANNPPVVINPIADVNLDEGFGTYNIDFSNVFDDVDGDVLSYSVSSSNTSVVGASISGNNILISEVGVGTATITLTADDGNGGTADDIFTVSVNAAANNLPIVINPIPDVNLDEGFGTYNINFSNVFDDPDGDVLSYSVSSSNTSVVSSAISGTNVVITEIGVGSATITLTANDGNGGVVNDVFTLVVIAEDCDPPINLEAYANSMDYSMYLNWEMGSITFQEFRYDDGVATGQLGSTTGTTNTVLGNIHTEDTELTEMSWYLTAESGPHNSIVIYVMGLDASGIPDGNNVLFSQEVSNTDEQWNTYLFDSPIAADGGFFLGVAYDGFVAIGTDDGVGVPYEFVENTHFFTGDYTAGGWETWETYEFEVNGMLRAKGVSGAVNSYSYADIPTERSHDFKYVSLANPVMTDRVDTREFLGFNVYRDGNKINTSLVSEMSYVDPNLMPNGEYCYHVTAVYSECGESEFSNEACDAFWDAIPEFSLNDINIYPNPSTGLIYISIDNYSKSVNLSVYSLLGELITEKLDMDNESLSLDLSNNERGVYLVKIATDSDSFVKRVVIE